MRSVICLFPGRSSVSMKAHEMTIPAARELMCLEPSNAWNARLKCGSFISALAPTMLSRTQARSVSVANTGGECN